MLLLCIHISVLCCYFVFYYLIIIELDNYVCDLNNDCGSEKWGMRRGRDGCVWGEGGRRGRGREGERLVPLNGDRRTINEEEEEDQSGGLLWGIG